MLDDLLDDVDDVDVVKLKKKVIFFEHDQIINNLEISRLHKKVKLESKYN